MSMLCLTLFLRVWKPATIWTDTQASSRATEKDANAPAPEPVVHKHPRAAVLKAWLPWLILSVLVFLWGIPEWKKMLDGHFGLQVRMAGTAQGGAEDAAGRQQADRRSAVYTLNWLSATGSGILTAAIISGLVMGYKVRELLAVYWATIKLMRFSLLTIAAMLALGYTTRYSGLDTTLGLAFANTGVLYPFFGTLLGWLGVALTGSDTASNVLFGGLQKTSATQLGLDPVLMAAANSSGGVMGKMIDAQSIVVASTATKWYGHEGEILRYVFFHSIALACLVGVLVTLQAYVYPFTLLVP
jgi:lactate permease